MALERPLANASVRRERHRAGAGCLEWRVGSRSAIAPLPVLVLPLGTAMEEKARQARAEALFGKCIGTLSLRQRCFRQRRGNGLSMNLNEC